MAAELPVLVSQWKAVYSSIEIPVLGLNNAVQANPERLAIGFSNLLNNLVFIGPAQRPTESFSFTLERIGQLWFYWYKHGSMVNNAWNIVSTLGAPHTIHVAEIIRTDIGS